MNIEQFDSEVISTLQTETVEILKGTRDIRHAFVLLEQKKRRSSPRGWIEAYGVVTLNVEDQPNQRHLINDYVTNRGMKVIGYGNIPAADSKDPKRAKKYGFHSGPNGENDYDQLKICCEAHMRGPRQVAELVTTFKAQVEAATAERDKLKKALAELEAKHAGGETQKGGKSSANKDVEEQTEGISQGADSGAAIAGNSSGVSGSGGTTPGSQGSSGSGSKAKA